MRRPHAKTNENEKGEENLVLAGLEAELVKEEVRYEGQK